MYGRISKESSEEVTLIRYNHTSTNNPLYGGTARMMLFGEVERNMLIKDGVINVTTSAF